MEERRFLAASGVDDALAYGLGKLLDRFRTSNPEVMQAVRDKVHGSQENGSESSGSECSDSDSESSGSCSDSSSVRSGAGRVEVSLEESPLQLLAGYLREYKQQQIKEDE